MCCTPGKGHCYGHQGYGHGYVHGHAPGHRGCHCHGGHFQRHFYGKEEQLARLENYLKQLQAEVKAVEERIKELKA
ncbi:hypothetical protein [Desulfofundulus thermocisternus]|uniref:hypothetical protein n=1 Tax=Desulfofundulus thermocisternus TaxID=42471 RepID=UPI00217DE9E2|nr:hypothetical protein [Desulfofundulus thermocisternus]MCS5695329.1 hypothetical protein [Desulfofundulus thermocisternus]